MPGYDPDELVTVAAIASRTDRQDQAVYKAATRPGFPRAAGTDGQGRNVYRWGDVAAFYDAARERRSGPAASPRTGRPRTIDPAGGATARTLRLATRQWEQLDMRAAERSESSGRRVTAADLVRDAVDRAYPLD